MAKFLRLAAIAGMIAVLVTPSLWGHAGIFPAIFLVFKLQGREKLAGIIPILIVWSMLTTGFFIRARH